MAPKVQTIAEAMAELDPAYAASRNIVAQKQALIPAKYDAQRAGINAARGQGFSAINNQATGRGASFSGIPVDEQATYLSTKYLPGMMDTNTNQNAEDLALQGTLADLTKEQATAANSRVAQQQSDLNAWNKSLQEQEFTARENSRNRAASASANAASNPVASASEAAMAVLSGIIQQGGKITKDAFQLARRAYANNNGGSTKGFAEQFWSFVPKDVINAQKGKKFDKNSPTGQYFYG